MTFDIRTATPADGPEIRRLCERVFGAAMSEEEWAWKFDLNPDGWYGVVGVVGEEIVGNYSGWGMRLLLDGRPRLVYSIGDVATDPAVRGLGGRRGVYRAMTEVFYDTVERDGVPFCFGFPNSRANRVSERLAGTQTLFPIHWIEAPTDWFGAAPREMETGDSVGEGYDFLWENARRSLSHASVRDRARVNWRFHARPNRYYRMVWLTRSGAMTGWAALSVVGEIATVVDFLGSDENGGDLPPLFAAAGAEARRLGARRLAFWQTPGGPGHGVLDGLPGERRQADFPLIARVFDVPLTRRFAEGFHLVPSLYDLT